MEESIPSILGYHQKDGRHFESPKALVRYYKNIFQPNTAPNPWAKCYGFVAVIPVYEGAGYTVKRHFRNEQCIADHME